MTVKDRRKCGRSCSEPFYHHHTEISSLVAHEARLFARVAQLAEQLSCKQQVRSSILLSGSALALFVLVEFRSLGRNRREVHRRLDIESFEPEHEAPEF